MLFPGGGHFPDLHLRDFDILQQRSSPVRLPPEQIDRAHVQSAARPSPARSIPCPADAPYGAGKAIL